MPHLTNCSHLNEGWCLACVKVLHEDREKWKEVATKHLEHIDQLCAAIDKSGVQMNSLGELARFFKEKG